MRSTSATRLGLGPRPTRRPSRPPYSHPEGLRLPAAGRRAARSPGRARRVGVDPAQVAAAVQPLLRKRVLGPHVGVLVTDLDHREAALPRRAPTAITPASTTKLLTSTAALESLGPMAASGRRVRWVPGRRELVLVGGGDPFLRQLARRRPTSATRSAPTSQTLARPTVSKLRA